MRSERLCRFEFPERPGALTQFLEKLGGRWNISLFHYRNHGADFGRVLAGFEVTDEDLAPFRQFLDELGYPCTQEQENPAYKFFLGIKLRFNTKTRRVSKHTTKKHHRDVFS